MVNVLPVYLRPDGVQWVRLEANDTITPLHDVLFHEDRDGVPSEHATFIASSPDGPETITEAEARARYPEAMERHDDGVRARRAARARGEW